MASELLKMHKLQMISMVCGCGWGGSRTFENAYNSNDFHGSGAGGGGPAPAVGWESLVVREVLKMSLFVEISEENYTWHTKACEKHTVY